MALDAYRVKEAARALDAVEGIDQLIEWLGRDVAANAEDWGGKVKVALGQNRMNRISRERVGHIVFCGIVNDLLRERGEIVAEHKDVVNFPPAPCPEQTLPDQSS